MHGAPGDFLGRVFAARMPSTTQPILGDDLVKTVLAGGYPGAFGRPAWKRRLDWHRNYIDAILQRDIADVAQIEQLDLIPKLLRVLAEYSGQLINFPALGSPLAMNHVTTRKYLGVFQSLYLVRNLQAWQTNSLRGLAKSPKLHFLDSGLLAAQKGVSPDTLRRGRTPFGPLLEAFVLAELMKIANWSGNRYTFSHFRDRDRNEVDVVIEDQSGNLLGVEVKAAATAADADFKGLRCLAASAGDKFAFGMVLYDHDQAVPFGEKLAAVPISALWQSEPAGSAASSGSVQLRQCSPHSGALKLTCPGVGVYIVCPNGIQHFLVPEWAEL